MPEIAGGFIAYRREQMGIHEETEASLAQVYQASLSLLYKLLFLLYAEARALLPVENPGYREQSLTRLAQWAAQRLDAGDPLSDATFATPRYDALLALFRRVDRGDPSLGIPRYDGGLFNPQDPDNRFLESHRLSDRAVARAVDTLVRDAGEPVDYAYISVRNLGAIYEGLLEFKLQVDVKRENVMREDVKREDVRRENVRRENVRRENVKREDVIRDASDITHHASRITYHGPRITYHVSRITHHGSRFTFHPPSRERQRRA
jgi:hypothetical protein